MKFLLLLAVLIPSLSFAEMHQGEEDAPLRMAKVHGTIKKHVVENGSYVHAAIKVCDYEAEVPVYGPLPAQGRVRRDGTVAKCTTDVGGKPYTVQLIADALISPAGFGLPERKSIQAVWFIYQPGQTPNQYLSQTGGVDGEVNAKFLSANLYGTSYENLGLPKTFETFSIEMVLEDVNQ